MNLYKRGNIWYCKFRVDNVLYQFSCKTQDKYEAQEIASARHSDIIRKKFNLPQKYKKNYLFEPVFGNYIKKYPGAKSTLTSIISRSKNFLKIFKDYNIELISVNDIKNYQLSRKLEIIALPQNSNKREAEISFKSVNHEIQLLNNFFNFCIEHQYLDKNPCAGRKKLNELSRLKTLSDNDIRKLIDSATNELTRNLISFLVMTGCRKGRRSTLNGTTWTSRTEL